MIDVHSHVLPFVDDGARSVEVAIEMCRIAHRDGITHLVATPHANFKYNYDRDAYLARLAELQRQVPEVNLILGCDLHLSFENFEDAIANPAALACLVVKKPCCASAISYRRWEASRCD